MRRAPLLLPAAALVLAIAAEQHGWSVLALGCAGVAAARRATRAAAVALLLGLVLSAARGHPFVLTSERATARYVAVVTDDVRSEDTGLARTALTIDGIGAVRATLRGRVVAGERLLVRGRLEPFDEPRNPGEPSLREIERDDGFVARLASVTVLQRAPPDPHDMRTLAARLRAAASARIRAVVPEPAATLLAGALWGERGTLPDDLHAAFQATGTVHVLVTAGLHLGIVAGLAAFVLGRLGLHRIAGCAAALLLIAGYAWLTGAHLPAERAAAMIGSALVARACGARVTSWNALALAAIVVTALWPAATGSASFALSFSCVAAIVLLAEPLATLLHRLPVHERGREALALTIATQIGTWPLTAAVFSTLAPYAILANALVVPLMGIVLTGGIATLALPALAPLETLVLLTLEWIVRTVAALPGARATIATPPPLAIAAYDIAVLLAAAALRCGRTRLAGVTFGLACAAIAATAIVRPPHGLEITHLDVGQADAAVIRTPGDHIILIDTGGELEHPGKTSNAEAAGARIVLTYLRRTGVRAIDLMLETHPHGDHVGGCSPIIEALTVRMLFDSGQSYNGRAYRDCIASAHAHRVPVVLARRGMRWTSGDGVTLDILAPEMPFLADTGDDINENSIVTMLHYGTFRELFMGDAGESSETRLLASPDDNLSADVDVLKVGHHGSRYASTPAFIAAVHPHIAIISVGRHNTFGHPAEDTLDTLAWAGTSIFRTDRCGGVVVSQSGHIAGTLPCSSNYPPNRTGNGMQQRRSLRDSFGHFAAVYGGAGCFTALARAESCTTKTGSLLRSVTACATLPMSRVENVLCPRLPITIISDPISSAARNSSSTGSPSITRASASTPCRFANSCAARAISAASRRFSASTSGSHVTWRPLSWGCMARTYRTCSVAPSCLARSHASVKAACDGFELSTATRMSLNSRFIGKEYISAMKAG